METKMNVVMKISEIRNQKKGKKIERKCATCNKEFYVYMSSLISSNCSGKFCRRKCYNEYQKTLTKEKNNNFGSIKINCANCGKEFYLVNSKVGMYKNTFCSNECKYKYHHKYVEGEKNSNWKGGFSRYRGEEFIRIKKEYFNNSFCSLCGKTGSIHIHHIIPYRLTKDNNLDNLVPLCSKHHKIIEGIFTKNMEHLKDYEMTKFILNNILKTYYYAHLVRGENNERIKN